METVSIYEAKTQLSKYINLILSKEKDSIVITKSGVPVAEIIPFTEKKERRLGAAKGLWKEMSQEEFNDFDIASLFVGGIR